MEPNFQACLLRRLTAHPAGLIVLCFAIVDGQPRIIQTGRLPPPVVGACHVMKRMRFSILDSDPFEIVVDAAALETSGPSLVPLTIRLKANWRDRRSSFVPPTLGCVVHLLWARGLAPSASWSLTPSAVSQSPWLSVIPALSGEKREKEWVRVGFSCAPPIWGDPVRDLSGSASFDLRLISQSMQSVFDDANNGTGGGMMMMRAVLPVPCGEIPQNPQAKQSHQLKARGQQRANPSTKVRKRPCPCRCPCAIISLGAVSLRSVVLRT